MTVAASQVQIRWRRSDTDGQWKHMTIPGGQAAATITGVERGVTYQVEARSVAASGAASQWVAQTVTVGGLTVAPLPPLSLTATSIADGVHLGWSLATGAVQRTDVEYDVQRTPDLSGAPDPAHWASINSAVRSLSYTDGVTDGVVRWYRVRAVTYGGIASGFSSSVNSRGKVVADGATVGATIGPGGNVTGAVDANGRPIIDFTSAHLNNTLDHIGDGTTFKRLSGVNSDNTLHVSTPLLKQGSVLPNQSILINVAAPSTAPGCLIATFAAQSLLRADSSSLNVNPSNPVAATLLTNGQGELGTVGSQAPGWTLQSGAGLLEANDFVFADTKSMKVTNTASITNSVSGQDVSLVAGQIYVFEGVIKTDALPGGAGKGALLRLTIVSGISSFTILTKFGAYDAGLTTEPSLGLPADGVARGYTGVQCYFIPAANGVVQVATQNFTSGAGSAWFDNIFLYPFAGQFYTSLIASTAYYLYSYGDAITGNLLFANGAPPPTAPSDTFAMQCQLDGRIGFAPIKVTMPTSGGSFTGTGGGSGTCGESNEPVYVQIYDDATGKLTFEGIIKSRDVGHGHERKDGFRRGYFVKGWSFKDNREVYRAVQKRMLVPSHGWSIVSGHRVTPCDHVYFDGKFMPAWKTPQAQHNSFSGYKVFIQVQTDANDEHNYYLAAHSGLDASDSKDLLIHNGFVLGC